MHPVEVAFRSARRSGTGWWRTDCPLCLERTGKADRKGSMAVLASKGIYTCWKCAATGKIDVDPAFAEEMPDDEEVAEAARRAAEPPEGFVPLDSPDGRRSIVLAQAREYARTRCPESLWGEVGIGACATGYYRGRVVVPICAPDGRTWVGWVGRTWGPVKTRQAYVYPPGMPRGSILYNGRAVWRRTDRPLMVVEGVFDAIHLWPDAVAVLGKVSEQQVDILEQTGRPVAVVMDGDAWEEGLSLALRMRIRGRVAGNVRLPPRTDPDEVPRDWLDAEVAACLG